MSEFNTILNGLSPKEREKHLKALQKIGFSPAENEGFFTEFGQGFSKGFVQGVRGFGKTAQEFGISSADSVVDWADETLRTNQQWNEHENYTPLSLDMGNIGRAIGTGLGQTSTIAPAAIGASFIGSPLAGAAVVGGATFAQLYGDNVEDYRNKFKGKYSSGQITAMAVGKTLIDSTIETALGNVPMLGKISKGIVNKATKTAMQETVKKFGQSITLHILNEAGKGAIGEGSEEVLQYFNDAAFRALAGDETLDVKFKDVLESFAGGAWSGGLLGGASGIINKTPNLDNEVQSMNTEKHFSIDNANEKLNTSLQGVLMQGEVNKDVEVVAPRTKAAKMLKQLGTELGLDVNFFKPKTEVGSQFNGAFNSEDNRVWINAEKSANDPRHTLGHEFYHFLEKNNPEIANKFYNLVYGNLNQDENYNETKEEIQKLYSPEQANAEFTADRLGELFMDNELWKRVGQSQDVKFSQQLMQYINKFIETVKKVLGKSPNTVNFIKDLDKFKQDTIDTVLAPYLKDFQNNQIDLNNLGQIDLTNAMREKIAEKNKVKIDWDRFNDEYVNEKKQEKAEDENSLGHVDLTPSMRRKAEELTRFDMEKIDIEKVKHEASKKTTIEKTPKVEEVKKASARLQIKADDEIAKNKAGEYELPEFVNVDDLQIDPERFQFKENKNKKGVVVPLNGEFDQQTARPLFVWEDKNGKQFVVEGHHRLDLAKRNDVKRVLAYVHKETDGKSAEWARRRGVIMNIRDGQGSVRDYAEFFRNDDITYDEAKQRGLFRKDNEGNSNGEIGFAIGNYASDNLYASFRNNDISAKKTAIIAEAAKKDEGLEAAGLKKANAMNEKHLAEYMKLLKYLPREQSNQGDLFGFDDSAIIEADKVSERALEIMDEFRKLINAGKGSIKNPELVKKLKVGSGKTSAKLLEKAKQELKKYENYYTDPEVYNKLLEDVGLTKKDNGVKYSKYRYRQVNPILKDGKAYKHEKEFLDKYFADRKPMNVLKEEAGKKIAELGGMEKALKMALNGDLAIISDVNIIAVRTLMQTKEFADLPKEDRNKISTLYHKSLGTEAGRALAARRLGVFNYKDLDNVKAHIIAYLSQVKDEDKVVKAVKEATGVDLEKELAPSETATNETPNAEVNPSEKETVKPSEKENVKPSEKEKSPLQDPDKLNQVLETLLTTTKSIDDKVYEFWINSILSGLTSSIVNTVGNASNIAYDLLARRAVEATLNKFIFKKKDGATFEEFKQMAKAINWGRALKNASFFWKHETLVDNSKLDRANVAIGGKTGRVVRTPTRVLNYADEYAKVVIEQAEAATMATRLGKAQGLKGKQLENFIAEQLKDEDSPSWDYGRERAIELTFKSEPGLALSYLISLKNTKSVGGYIAKYFLPFIKGPANIISKGARVTPLGTIPLAKDLIQVAFKKKQFDNQSVSRIAEQVIAWGGIMALVSLMGDDDDYPIITGSQGALSATGRTFMRDKIPPYSIRIGDTYYSYKRLDPFATSLALIADGINSYMAYKGGAKSEEIIKNLVGSARSQFVDKSFFNAFNQLYQTLSTEGYAFKWGANFASSWMPNVVRQTVGYFNDNINTSSNQSKGRDWYENMFYMTVDKAGLVHASPKIDYLGREVKKDSVEASSPLGIMARIFALNPQTPDENMGNVDRLLFNYAKQNPESAYYPDVPSYFFRHNGKVIYFTANNYQEYAKDSGELAHKQINNAIKHGFLNVEKPTEKDIKIIKGIFQRSRNEVKKKLIKENKFSF